MRFYTELKILFPMLNKKAYYEANKSHLGVGFSCVDFRNGSILKQAIRKQLKRKRLSLKSSSNKKICAQATCARASRPTFGPTSKATTT